MTNAWKRLARIFGISLLLVVVLVASGLLLADHLTPRATGAPSQVLALQADQTAFGAPAYGACHVGLRRRTRAPGKDEFLQRRQTRIAAIEVLLERRDPPLVEHDVARDGQLPAEIEKIVLHARETGADVLGKRLGEQGADVAVQLVHAAQRIDAGAVLRDAAAVTQAGIALVAGSRIDPAQPMAHGVAPSRQRAL